MSILRYFMDGDVQKIHLVIGFWFRRELHVRVECVEVILYVYDVSVAGVKIIRMSSTYWKYAEMLFLLRSGLRCVSSRF